MTDYLIKVRGESKGPYSESQLLTQIRRKRLSRQHQVSSDGGMTWLRAGDEEALFPASAAMEDAADQETEIETSPPGKDHFVKVASDASERLWSYAAMGQQLGPVPESEVRMLIASGGIRDDTLVWQEGMTDWVEVQHVPTFSAAVQIKQSSATGKSTTASGMPPNVSDQKTLHWPSVIAMLTAIAGWTCLLPSAICAVGMSGALQDRFSAAGADSVIAMLLMSLLVVSPSVLFCVTSINLGHKAIRYSNREPGLYDGTTYSIFALILGYLSALCLLVLAIFCIVSASR